MEMHGAIMLIVIVSSDRLEELGIKLGAPGYKVSGLSTTPQWILGISWKNFLKMLILKKISRPVSLNGKQRQIENSI